MRNLERIKKLLDIYDKKATEICKSITRRGFCEQININIVFPNLKKDLKLEEINLERTRTDLPNQVVDIQKLDDTTYIKRLCICDKICGDDKCTKYKDKLNCDGHHVIVVSPRKDTEIDVNQDYVIDFTYKQMLIGPSEDDIEENKIRLAALPNYLFMKLNDYINYSTIPRWIENITKPCKNIVNNYKQKYLKYKQKYLQLKNMQKGGKINYTVIINEDKVNNLIQTAIQITDADITEDKTVTDLINLIVTKYNTINNQTLNSSDVEIIFVNKVVKNKTKNLEDAFMPNSKLYLISSKIQLNINLYLHNDTINNDTINKNIFIKITESIEDIIK